MKKQFLSFLPALAFCVAGSFVFSSCGKDEETVDNERKFENGVFVTNEGQFLKSNGEVSFIAKANKEVEPNLFSAINNRPVGDVVQSMMFFGDKAYIVVNNSAKIEITDARTFKSIGVINSLKLPRYMAIANNKAYISSWVKADFTNRTPGEIAVVDLSSNTVTKTIQVGWLPERLLVTGNKLFVTNSNDNTVSVINLGTDAVENTITVGDSPNSLALDAAGKLWVLTGGSYATSSPSKLHRVNPADNAIETTLTFPFGSAEDLTITADKRTLLYNFGGQVFRMGTTETALPTTPLVDRYFYGLGIDPETNLVYGADAGTFDSNGKVIRYNTSGQAVDSFNVGVAPNDFYFR